jgi:UDP-N-acetylglucosamine 2-epimerase
LFTYHPTSYGDINILNKELDLLISILKKYKNTDFIITGPGMELGSDKARELFKTLSKNFDNIFYVEHLGRENYISMMKYSDLVIGNSSSGICEAPSVGTPSINIGDRQEGRFRANSTIDCNFDFNSISNALENIFSNNFKDIIKKIENPYDPFLDGKNSERIAKTCIFALEKIKKNKLLKKSFDQRLNSKLWNTLN